MEKEVVGLLELFKKGLTELPKVGTEAWTMMTNGYSIEHWVYAFIGIGLAVVSVVLFIFSYKTHNKSSYLTGDDSTALAFIGSLILIISVIVIGVNIPRALAPDYFIIKTILVSL